LLVLVVISHQVVSSRRHWYCFTEWREWFTVWVNAEELIPILVNCWYERMSLHFDSTSGRSFNPPGTHPHTGHCVLSLRL
jgi:hypothetical protein